MRTGKGSQEEEEYEEEEFVSKKQSSSSSSNQTMSVDANNNNTNTHKDAKNSDKANAIRSKHSVTEKRRRSKINERFQILRDIIPNTDQKRNMASFLLEVIEYVQYLQEKVKKCEGSYQGWSSEPPKLIPWRNSHWRVQSFAGHQQSIKNGSGPESTFSGKFDENNININPTMIKSAQNPVETDPNATSKALDRQPKLANMGMPLPIQGDNGLGHPFQMPVSEAQLTNTLNQQEDLTIEGGTISISSVYSQGLLDSLTQALQSVGLDMSQANISVQIDLGKNANRGLTAGTSAKDQRNSLNHVMTHLRDVSNGKDSDHSQKRLKK